MLIRLLLLLRLAFLAALAASAALSGATPLVLSQAMSVNSSAAHFPEGAAAQAVRLPDDWTQSRPRYDGGAWYRVGFDLPSGAPSNEPMALYLARVCGALDVELNGQRIHSDARNAAPATRNCQQPRWVSLPSPLLKAQGNVLDLRMQASALQRVASRHRVGALSELHIGRDSELAGEHASRLFRTVSGVQIVGASVLLVGCLVLLLYAFHRRETPLLHFGGLLVGWAVVSALAWWPDLPLDSKLVEVLVCSGFAVVAAFAVQFLLSHAGLRSRPISIGLALQLPLVPASLWWADPNRIFAIASAWHALFALEVFATMGLALVITWRRQRDDFVSTLLIVAGTAGVLLFELATQVQLLPAQRVPVLQYAMPLVFFAVGARLVRQFARTLRAAEESRASLENRVKEITADIERNFTQLSELRVEQVTEKERKRIAADLHDDLGAKLLTIVHTSESERISTLAREALEEMRLSVRGLTGKPVRLADALADWRAETVSRLGQANIEADWRGPTEEIEHLLPARAYVQTTRILREAVSNIIKHSGASHCKVRSSVGERDFGMLVQDNGKGIPMELDGKLDRGHGMSSMKHRAKQLQGQCLVESGPGYGTVIRLTLPL